VRPQVWKTGRAGFGFEGVFDGVGNGAAMVTRAADRARRLARPKRAGRRVGRTLCVAASALAFALGALTFSPMAVAQRSILGLEEPGANEPMRLNADRLSYTRSGRTAIATGNVEIQYGNYTVFADRVSYSRDKGTLTASGNVRLIEPGGNVVEARHIELADKFREGFVRQLTLLMTNDARLHARSAERRKGNITILNEASYTACKACEEDPSRPLVWEVKARRVIHDKQEREITYEDASLEFLGMPILYVPGFSHPDPTVRRKSGFLVPSFTASDEFGFGVEVPYFFNLAPNYDFTASPVFTTEQGMLFQGEWRHRVANGQYSITPTGIYELSPEVPSARSRWRGSVNSRGNFNLSQHWQFGWDGTVLSDDTYMRRYKIDKRTDIVSQAHLTGINDRNYFDARAYHFRGVLPTDVDDRTPYVVPQVDHEYRFNESLLGGTFGIDSNIMNLHREIGPDSTRASTNLHWQRQWTSRPGLLVTPFAQVRGDLYHVNNVPDPTVAGGIRGKETFGRFLPAGGVDLRMPFVQHTSHGNHIFEPIAQVIARPNETRLGRIPNEDSLSFQFDDVNLFSINKFTGRDRWEGGSRANVGFNYTVNLNNGATARLTAGESFHIAGRNSYAPGTGLDRERSDFVGSVYLLFDEHFSASARMQLDEDTLDVRRNEVGARAKFERFTGIVNYAQLDSLPAFGLPTSEEEVVFSGSLRFTERWRVFGGLRYDLARDRFTTDSIGLGYEDECFGFSLAYRETFTEDRDVDPERSVMLRFELKTIGSGGFSAGID